MEDEPVTKAFHRYFRLTEPRTPEDLEDVYRLRYEVYCREFHFEREEDCPGGRETDDFDNGSWHCLMHHRDTGTAAGCVRLVPAAPDGEYTELPMERYCRDSFYDVAERPDRLDRSTVCEVSRLAVHSLFRRRHGEQHTPLGDISSLEIPPNHVRTFPLLALSLFMSATALATIREKEHAFAMMEPALARILRRAGLPAIQVGEVQEYHGQRAAFYIHRESAKRGIESSELLSELYRHAYRQLSGNHQREAVREIGQMPFAA